MIQRAKELIRLATTPIWPARRWHALLHPGFVQHERVHTRVRGQAAIRIAGRKQVGPKITLGAVQVVQLPAGFLVVVTQCPAEQQKHLEGDFERIMSTLELDKDGIDPEPQGPLAEKRESAGRK